MNMLLQKVFSKVAVKSKGKGGASSSGYPRTPGERDGQPLNSQVISRRWYPRPKPAVDSTISVVDGLHRTNTTPVFQSGAITVTAATRWIETLVMSHATEYETKTEATQLFSGGGSVVFTAKTMEDPAITANFIADGSDLIVDGSDFIIDGE